MRLRISLALAAICTIICGLVYVAVQQDLRQSANDPQVQLAQDAAASLAAGRSPSTYTTSPTVNLRTSLAPFIIVYSSAGRPIAGNGVLDGRLPVLPNGVFGSNSQKAFTWEPAPGVRQAAVLVPYHGGYVLAARSLQQVEQRETYTLVVAAVAWVATLVAIVLILGWPFGRDQDLL